MIHSHRTIFTVARIALLVFWMQLLLHVQNQANACQVPAGVSREEKPSDVASQWKGIIGDYTHGNDTISLFERDGSLYLSKNSAQSYRLQPGGSDRFEILPPWSDGSNFCVVHRNQAGAATSLDLHSLVFQRILYGGENGDSFRIKPLKSIDILRNEALLASPPREEGSFEKSDLVEIRLLDSTVHLDVRYATTNNFMGAKFYSQARAFLQRPAAEALVMVQRALRTVGYGLLIHDAYRPWYVTKMFWDATPKEQKDFVADPAKGSRHNRGCAVDLSLYDLKTGKAIEMVSGYDEFSHRAYPNYPGGSSLQRWHRQLLRRAMEAEGFKVFEVEWWHFDFGDWRSYPIGTVTFEEIR